MDDYINKPSRTLTQHGSTGGAENIDSLGSLLLQSSKHENKETEILEVLQDEIPSERVIVNTTEESKDVNVKDVPNSDGLYMSDCANKTKQLSSMDLSYNCSTSSQDHLKNNVEDNASLETLFDMPLQPFEFPDGKIDVHKYLQVYFDDIPPAELEIAKDDIDSKNVNIEDVNDALNCDGLDISDSAKLCLSILNSKQPRSDFFTLDSSGASQDAQINKVEQKETKIVKADKNSSVKKSKKKRKK